MDLVIGLIIIFGGIFAYGYLQQSKWEKIYRIEIGKYYKMTPEKAAKKTRFDGTCYFDEMAEPINVGIRLSKGEKIYAAFENLSLMAYKRTGGFGFGGIFLRKKVAPAIYLRGGLGKFGLSKSLQADAVGTLYVTNKGVFYVDDLENSVHLRSYDPIPSKWANNRIAKRWDGIRRVRQVVMSALENARNEGKIGSSLQAALKVHVSADVEALFDGLDAVEKPSVSGFQW